jgi:hypothetical protein
VRAGGRPDRSPAGRCHRRGREMTDDRSRCARP